MNMNVGIRAHDFGKLPLEELARKVGERGFRSIQLALAKALSDIDSTTGKLSPGLANHIAEAFDKQGVRIAILGCYINPVHPDPEQRRQEIRRFKEHLRYARDFGTSIVATETGRRDTFRGESPDGYAEKAWSIFRDTISELAEEAEKWGVIFGIEPATTLNISTTDDMLRIMEEVPSTNIGVVLDPCNLLDADNVERQDEVIERAFSALADRIAAFHAKDILTQPKFGTYTGLGQGVLNYPLFLQRVRELKPHADILLEGLTLDNMDASLEYFTKVWNEAQ